MGQAWKVWRLAAWWWLLAGGTGISCRGGEETGGDGRREVLSATGERQVVWRPLTRGPRQHWFSYYDVLQFDPAGKRVLAMAVDFEGRQPLAGDEIEVGMVELAEGDRWVKLGTTTAWCWQQGCRLQWRPGSDREVLWNDREDGRYVCRVLDLRSGRRRTLPSAVDHLSPAGKWALVADFARVGHLRPDYGYQGIEDPRRNERAPRESGVWRVDLDSGERRMLLSLAEVAAIPSRGYAPNSQGRHYINHLAWSPDGKRFLFLNRGEGVDRMFTADADGGNLRYICAKPSHYVWRDAATILCWTGGAYRLFRADGSAPDAGEVLFEAPNGHQTYLPGGEWLLTDTYPQGPQRIQTVYLYHLASGRKVTLGEFPSPAGYQGPWRCDTHPRLSPDGGMVTIDSPHEGGRQVYCAEIGSITGSVP